MSDERAVLRKLAAIYFDKLYRCPTTGRIIESLPGDDKVLCRCGVSNPKVPQEETHRTGVHICRFLTEATMDEYLDQRMREAAQDRTRRG